MLRVAILVVGATALLPRPQPQIRSTTLRAAALEWSPAGVAQADGTLVSKTFAYAPTLACAADAGVTSIETSYVAVGAADAPPVLLVHGFGASPYHWRATRRHRRGRYRVYAVDLCGFGRSEKPVMDYDSDLSCGASRRSTARAASRRRPTSRPRRRPRLSGRRTPPRRAGAAALGAAVRRAVVAAAFVVTKQPLRIQQVLRQVYPVFPERCDDDLVASIEYPARDPNAAEVFYRIVSRNGNGPADPARSVDALLAQLAAPLLLCWGERDPWVVSAIGDRYEAAATALGRDVTRVSIDGGHCPHDENPAQVNAALLDWMGGLA
ncbi:abhydrolase [Aureococcus anophagefferens]|uniref:Abhydrolase n=1 Tax=Aureococcus anophagefferens TaxID=44056 RepID=A0ABR1G331_AURAN